MKKVTAVVIGAGVRGQIYAAYANESPDKLKMVGVVEPRTFQREKIADCYEIPQEKRFKDIESFVSQGKMADCVFICTLEKLHKHPAVACAKLGYHILLEKPMATSLEDCEEIVRVCEENDVTLAVCHVLRYTPQARKIQEIIRSGRIGDIVNIQLLEPIGYWRFAHSFVRGNWHNTDESTFSLFVKSCHDLDLINFWFGDEKCRSVQSFGSLKHFRKEYKPEGASDRCMDCKVEATCPYSAKKLYLNGHHSGWSNSVIADVPDIEAVTEALKTGPYGKCVYNCDNDVMDNQVVNMQYDKGATASFTMVAFTKEVCSRQARIFGTMGEISCDFGKMDVVENEFSTGQRTVHDLNDLPVDIRMTGHGGADFNAMEAFVKAVGTGDRSAILTGPQETLASHKLCFLAEKARLEHRVVDIP